MEVITRKEAIERGLKLYFTGRPCKRGHISPRYTVGKNCKACNKEKSRRASVESTRRKREWREKNPDKNKAWWKAWQAANRDKLREYKKRYMAQNPHLVAFHTARRRKREREATPAWVDWAEIERVYKQARLAQAVTGLDHHVDHIVPLGGKNVCGLHVPWNLQVLEASENMSKGNRL